jgi:hypothetical protein
MTLMGRQTVMIGWIGIQTVLEAPEASREWLGYVVLFTGGLVAVTLVLLTVRYLIRPEKTGEGHIKRRPLPDESSAKPD